MASILSKNGILSGRLDYYCLICAEHFSDGEAAIGHILLNLQHEGKLKACGYFEKFSEDFIRKANGVYFCEPCGLTFPTIKKVELHIDEPTHIEEKSKGTSWLNRVNNDIIAFNKFLISDDAWNGCVEDTCVLCNAEFDDSAPHKATRSHIFNLMKSDVVFDKDEEAVYRMIDAKSNQCLTCNSIIGNDPKDHFKSTEHKAAYKMYDHRSRQTNGVQKEIETTNTQNESQNVKAKTEKNDLKDNSNTVNGNDTASAEKVEEAVEEMVKQDAKKPLKAKPKKGVEKTKENVDSPKKLSSAELDKLYCKNLKAVNYITTGEGERWCVLCEWLLIESPESHIRTPHHQNMLTLHKQAIADKDSNNNKNVASKDEKTNLFENVDKYQMNNVNINLIHETAFCKKCSKNIDFNTSAIEKHIEGHNNVNTKKSQKSPSPLLSGIKSNGTDKTTLYTKPVLLTGKDKRDPRANVASETQVQDFAKQHGLSHNRADKSYYCNLCSRRLPTNLNDLQNHVASRIHTENMAKQSLKTAAPKAPVKVPLSEKIKTVEFTESIEEGCVMIINDKYWINAFGFFMIAKSHDTIMCHGCHIDLTRENVMQHIALSDYHRQLWEKCLLITSLEGEFIREIKLDVYHCGYCNIIENDWDDMLDHISTYEHKKEKGNAEECLRKHVSTQKFRVDVRQLDDTVSS